MDNVDTSCIIWFERTHSTSTSTRFHALKPTVSCIEHRLEAPQITANAKLYVIETMHSDVIHSFYTQITPSTAPIVYIIGLEQLETTLPLLRACDEVCLDSDPLSLLQHRITMTLNRCSACHIPQLESIDSLTGVLNRSFFYSYLERVLSQQWVQAHHSFLLINIDHFKALNDTWGHACGDQVLVELAACIRDFAPSTASIARVGGEEFAVFLQAHRDDSSDLASELCEYIAFRAFCVNSVQPEGVSCTVSVGVTTVVKQHVEVQEVLRLAREALYAAKARGRNQVVHSEQLLQEALQKGTRPELETFENMTRVLTERIGEVLAGKGRRLFEEIRKQADHDPLTGLFSRRYFDRRLSFEWNNARNSQNVFSLGLIDVDFFGEVNKTHGWPTGDKILQDVAHVITQECRSQDWVARYGGEELCVIMSNTRLQDAQHVLERVRKKVESVTFYSTNQKIVPITVSIGGTSFRSEDVESSALLERVSSLLLRAKQQGKNCSVVQ